MVGYSNAMKMIEAGDFNGVDPIFLQIACKFDNNLGSYVDATRMLKTGDYEQAEEAFSALSGYRDADQLLLEARYRNGEKLLNEEKFDEAYEIFMELGEYSGSADKLLEIRYEKALMLFETGSDLQGYQNMKELAETGYQRAVEGLAILNEELYNNAAKQYRAGLLDSAQKRFIELKDYKDTDKYLTLCTIKTQSREQRDGSSLERDVYRDFRLDLDVSQCLEMIKFEDAAKVIVWDTAHAEYFLRGTWRTYDGSLFFSINGDQSSSNLPGMIQGSAFEFEKGQYKADRNRYDVFDFTVINENAIEVFCRGNWQKYYLYRE